MAKVVAFNCRRALLKTLAASAALRSEPQAAPMLSMITSPALISHAFSTI